MAKQSNSSMPGTYVDGFHDRESVMKMHYNRLGATDLEVSVLSLGASSLGSVFRQTDNDESLQVVRHALRCGINYVDVAPWYGHGKAESVLGEALKGVPRESCYIATKVGRYEPEVEKMFDFSAERTLQSVDESLNRLGLDYVDIIQVHDMEFAADLDIVVKETLPALQKLKDAGKVKFIGITGYPLQNFKTVLEKSTVKIDSILTYCRCCMNDNSLADYIPYFKEKGVDLSKLAMDFTLKQPGIHTTLVSTASLENLKKNLCSVHMPLTQAEKEIQEEIMEKFMKPLHNKNWEGVEVDQYWANLKTRKR